MKIAYLITAFNNYNHLERLIEALDDSTQPTFFLHIDRKSTWPKFVKKRENLNYIERKKVWWGGWSHLEAILSLMKAASKNRNDYYVLLSGTDYPIRPNSFLYDRLKEGGEFINIMEGFHSHKPIDRVKYYYFDAFDRRNTNSLRTKIFLNLEKGVRKLFIKKEFPFNKIYHGSTWWALSDKMVQYILEVVGKDKKIVKFFKSSWCPEESLIPTIIGNSPIKYQSKNYLTFTDWTTNPAPANITKNHVKLFKNQTDFDSVYGQYSPFFARKFNDDSRELIKEIEKDLR